MTVEYLRDTAHQAGLDTAYLPFEDISYNRLRKEFCDPKGEKIENIFKLQPWEQMILEEGANYLKETNTTFIEPAWKMLWSNKGLLPILWEIAPNHPYLLPAYFDKEGLSEWVKKPLFGREGANVTINTNYSTYETEDYGEEGFVYQEYFAHPSYYNYRPLIGLWMIGDECVGMGIRESEKKITDNLSRFVPHIIK